jgi:hypothetical protein
MRYCPKGLTGDALFIWLLSGWEMPKEQTDPTFEPRKAENDTGYFILVTWPDGRTEQLSGFKDETAALDWIRVGSRSWIARKKS